MNIREKLHNADIRRLSKQVKFYYRQKKKFHIYHGSTNSTRTQKFDKDSMVDISHFNRIIEINTQEKYAIVEPNVPLDQLIRATLRHGLVLPVVPEFPGITIGGGVQGCAAESSSFKWGAFHHACFEYEIILGDGEIVTATAKENADLFWGTACSYGSLGIITKIKIRLIAAKKYVRLTYHRVNSFKQAIAMLEKQVRAPVDFIDGILFSKEMGTIMTGCFLDNTDLPRATFSKPTDNWFYLHAEQITKKYEIYDELIPLEDYLFRYNRGAFWVGKYAFSRSKIPFNRFTRFIFDPLFKTRTLYRFLQAINISQKQIVQDLIVPKETIIPFLNYIDKTLQIYPLWLLPCKLAAKFDKLSPGFIKTKLGIDIGIWGKVYGDYDQVIRLNRDIEKKLQKAGGRKVLYAHAYYPRDEFWQIYDERWYRGLRRKYVAETVFPDIYDKTFVSEKYTVSFWKGLFTVIRSPFKLPVKANFSEKKNYLP